MNHHSADDSNIGVSLGHALCLIPDQYSTISGLHIIMNRAVLNTVWLREGSCKGFFISSILVFFVVLIIAGPTLQCCLVFSGEDAILVFICQHQKAIKAAFSEQRWILGRVLFTSSALPSLTSSLPSCLVFLGDIADWLWFIFTFQAYALLSLSLCAKVWSWKGIWGLCALSLSLSLSVCPLYIHTSRWICFDMKKQIIKDSCKTKKEISIAQGHYKDSVC